MSRTLLDVPRPEDLLRPISDLIAIVHEHIQLYNDVVKQHLPCRHLGAQVVTLLMTLPGAKRWLNFKMHYIGMTLEVEAQTRRRWTEGHEVNWPGMTSEKMSDLIL